MEREMSDKSDRVAVNREYRGSETGNQAENVTGKPVKAPEKPSNLSGQVRHIEIDGSKWATDKGGLSTAFGTGGEFGKGGIGSKRGTSGESTVTVKQTPESKR